MMATYFYTDDKRQPIGPISLDRLAQLREDGVLDDHTPVIESGSNEWRTFADIARTTRRATGPYTPPPLRSPKELARDRLNSAQRRAAATIRASSDLVQDSIRGTFRAATTVPQRASLYGSVLGASSFFLPWIERESGFALAREFSAALWLCPVSFAVVFLVATANARSSSARRLLRTRWVMIIGVFWCALSLVATLAGRALLGVASLGLYLTLLSSTAVAAGGFAQIGDEVSATTEEAT